MFTMNNKNKCGYNHAFPLIKTLQFITQIKIVFTIIFKPIFK